jgi:hypothetical protein
LGGGVIIIFLLLYISGQDTFFYAIWWQKITSSNIVEYWTLTYGYILYTIELDTMGVSFGNVAKNSGNILMILLSYNFKAFFLQVFIIKWFDKVIHSWKIIDVSILWWIVVSFNKIYTGNYITV